MRAPGEVSPAFHRQPVFGHPVQVPLGEGSLLEGQLVLFVGHLVEARARALLSGLQARVKEAESRRVGLVAITSATEALASDFVPRYHLLVPLVVDPDGVLHQDYGVPQRTGLRARARAVLGGSPDGWMEALTLGLGGEALAGWRPAAFRLGPDGRVLAAQSEEDGVELDLDGLLACDGS